MVLSLYSYFAINAYSIVGDSMLTNNWVFNACSTLFYIAAVALVDLATTFQEISPNWTKLANDLWLKK